MKKKALSLLLVIMICCLSVFGPTAFAETVDDAVSSEEVQTITVPQIRITTEEGNGTALQKDDGYVNASVTITDTDGTVLSDSVQFKVRGNTTAMTTIKKKAFTFKFGKKKNVLGLGSGKKWALLANAFDPTMLRNVVANTIAHELSLDYTSNRRFVELWVDDSYRGCYDLFEPVEEGKDRVDIDIKSNNGMNDFLIEYEASRVEDDVTYFTVEGLRFISSEPETPNEEQLAYITGTMEDIVHTLQNGTKEEIEEKIDVDSFAKYYLLNEYVKTFDFDMSSVFYYYQDGQLHAGPAWDYDLSAGNCNDSLNYYRYNEAIPTTGLYCDQKNIYRYICDKGWFMDAVADIYAEHYEFFCDVYADGGLMDRLYQENSELFARNFGPDAWRVSQAWINIQKKPLSTYQENFDYLKNWYKERNLWLSEYFAPDQDSYRIGDADNDGFVTIIDATTIQRYLAKMSTDSFCEEAADVDRDGYVAIIDATLIQRYLVRLTPSGEIGKVYRASESTL